mmetsp:Transcript_160839/g.390719  ORF Transcript_160839/g.390719 Transcript_160839/m.390719 type:complete len:305 (-) Transcript_160839:33-947(-)
MDDPVREVTGLFTHVFRVGIPHDDHHDHRGEASARTDLADELCHVVELLLERGVLGLRRKARLDAAPPGRVADGDDQRPALACRDLAAREQEGVLVSILPDVLRFAGQAALVALHVVAVDEDAVRRDLVAFFEVEHFADLKLLHRHVDTCAVADRLDRDGILHSVQLAELLLLRIVVASRHKRNNQHGQHDCNAVEPALVRVLDVSDDHGHDGSDDQDDEGQVIEGLDPQPPEALGGRLRHHVVAERRSPRCKVGGLLLRSEAALDVHVEPPGKLEHPTHRLERPLVFLRHLVLVDAIELSARN